MDMRGFNDSDKPAGIKSYFILNMVEDVRQVVAGLGKERFALVAHDWGGVIAWTFAALHPDLLDNLILCNMPHPVPFNQARRSIEQALKSWYIVYFQVPILPEIDMMLDDIKIFDGIFKDNPKNDEGVREAYKYAFRDFTTWNRTINYYRCTTYNATSEALNGKLLSGQKIKVRTLQIFGTGDTAISVGPAKDTAKWVEDYRLELLDGVSHWVQEQEPVKVNKFIETFVKGK